MSYDPRHGRAGLIESVLASLCIKVALASVMQSSECREWAIADTRRPKRIDHDCNTSIGPGGSLQLRYGPAEKHKGEEASCFHQHPVAYLG